jgi:tetratricopeptide (TPR) repeat protein
MPYTQAFWRVPGFAILVICLSVCLWAAAATASVEATEPQPSRDQDALFEALKAAPTEADAQRIENDIWLSWLDAAPTPEIRSKLDTAMQRRVAFDFQSAKQLLDEIVTEAPEFSEGWNQRAFILFLQGNYEASLEDIERVLDLEPRHFGALSGRAIIFMTMGRVELGQKALREAMEIHPFLKERGMLIEQKGLDL